MKRLVGRLSRKEAIVKRMVTAGALGLLLTLFASVVIASTAVPFIAASAVAVVDPGTSELKVTPKGIRMKTQGEVISGTVVTTAGTWPDLEGASFTVAHSSSVLLDPLSGEILKGKGKGTFVLVKKDTDGNVLGEIVGKYKGHITGNFFLPAPYGTGPGGVLQDDGKWKAVDGTGIFEDVEASGTWNASLQWNDTYGTFVGQIVLQGDYEIELEDGEGDDGHHDHDDD
jgi:uncharacterized membrane protein